MKKTAKKKNEASNTFNHQDFYWNHGATGAELTRRNQKVAFTAAADLGRWKRREGSK